MEELFFPSCKLRHGVIKPKNHTTEETEKVKGQIYIG